MHFPVRRVMLVVVPLSTRQTMMSTSPTLLVRTLLVWVETLLVATLSVVMLKPVACTTFALTNTSLSFRVCTRVILIS